MNAPAGMSDMMAALKASYQQKLMDRLIGMENASVVLDGDASNADAMGLIRRECHKLSGVSNSLGYTEIGELATTIDVGIAVESKPWAELKDSVEALLDKMEEALDE